MMGLEAEGLMVPEGLMMAEAVDAAVKTGLVIAGGAAEKVASVERMTTPPWSFGAKPGAALRLELLGSGLSRRPSSPVSPAPQHTLLHENSSLPWQQQTYYAEPAHLYRLSCR